MPTQLASRKKTYDLFHSSSFGYGVLTPQVTFLHKEKQICVGDIAWYFWGFPHVPTDRRGWTWMEQLRHYSDKEKKGRHPPPLPPTQLRNNGEDSEDDISYEDDNTNTNDNNDGNSNGEVEEREDGFRFEVQKGDITYFVDHHNRVLLGNEIVGEFVKDELILFDMYNLERKISHLSVKQLN